MLCRAFILGSLLLTACDDPLSAPPVARLRAAAELPTCADCARIERPDVPPLDGPARIAPPPEEPAEVPPPPPIAPRDDVHTRFARTSLGEPDRHLFSVAPDDGIAYGGGAALLDVDGDLLADLFLSGSGPDSTESCVYHNRSTPGAIAFERVDDWCFDDESPLRFGFGIDLENDGIDELLVGWRDALYVRDLDDGSALELTQLLDRPCLVTSVAHTDLDLDGDADLLLACAVELIGERLDLPQPLVGLERTVSGFARMNPADVPWGTTSVNALALTPIDAELDGDLDIAVVSDTFSRPGATNLRLDPGGLARRCAPSETCTYLPERFLSGPAGWGSFMGASPLRVGEQRLLYLTDWGLNRTIEFDELPASSDRAARYRLQPPPPPGRDLFSWSALVEDFDLDGDDDIFVTAGETAIAFERSGWRFHFDALMTQGTGNVFVPASEAVGIVPHAWAADAGPAFHYSSRAAVRADLDLDGRLDVIVLPFVGYLRAYTVVSDPIDARCTVHVVPSVLEGRHGYAVIDPAGHRIDRLAEAHMRFGSPRSFVTPVRSGHVRFPSGADVPYACDASNEVIVREPEWIRLTVDGCVRLRLDPRVVRPDESWSFVVDDGPRTSLGALSGPLDDEGQCLPGVTSVPASVVFERDGRTVPRRFVP